MIFHKIRSFGLAFGAMVLALTMGAGGAFASPDIGALAPEFSAVDSNGKMHNLSDFKGKTVVLEWTNHGCPFVRKHYDSGNMQDLQAKATEDGVVWLSVISSAPGKQGYVSGGQANKLTQDRDAHPSAVLLDESGKIGRKYGAKTTPHMYVIDADGALQYKGAIDDTPSANPRDAKGAHNYVMAAIEALKVGEKPDPAETRPYGCSVKYAR